MYSPEVHAYNAGRYTYSYYINLSQYYIETQFKNAIKTRFQSDWIFMA